MNVINSSAKKPDLRAMVTLVGPQIFFFVEALRIVKKGIS